jgi:hypothetical protein
LSKGSHTDGGLLRHGLSPYRPWLNDLSACSVGALDGYAVETRRRVMEHRRALGRRVTFGQPLEGVIQHVVE